MLPRQRCALLVDGQEADFKFCCNALGLDECVQHKEDFRRRKDIWGRVCWELRSQGDGLHEVYDHGP